MRVYSLSGYLQSLQDERRQALPNADGMTPLFQKGTWLGSHNWLPRRTKVFVINGSRGRQWAMKIGHKWNESLWSAFHFENGKQLLGKTNHL